MKLGPNYKKSYEFDGGLIAPNKTNTNRYMTIIFSKEWKNREVKVKV